MGKTQRPPTLGRDEDMRPQWGKFLNRLLTMYSIATAVRPSRTRVFWPEDMRFSLVGRVAWDDAEAKVSWKCRSGVGHP